MKSNYKLGIIYKITNTHPDANGFCYVGKTTLVLKLRMSHLFSHARNGNGNQEINKAIRKYGEEYFIYEAIEENILKEDLDEREKYWIKESKSDKFNNYQYA